MKQSAVSSDDVRKRRTDKAKAKCVVMCLQIPVKNVQFMNDESNLRIFSLHLPHLLFFGIVAIADTGISSVGPENCV